MFKALRARRAAARAAADCYQGKHDLQPHATHRMNSGLVITVRKCSQCEVVKATRTKHATVSYGDIVATLGNTKSRDRQL